MAYVDGVRCYDIVEGLLVESAELVHQFGPPHAPAGAAAGGGGAAAAALAAAAAAEGRSRDAQPGSSLDHCSLVRCVGARGSSATYMGRRSGAPCTPVAA